jgi:AcrR family transcriptional regulator
MATRRDNPYWRTKHERISEAAFEEFSKSGFDLASMEKIAESAGVSKVTVYNHFATKDQLFAECIEYFFEFIFKPFTFDPDQHSVDRVFTLELFIAAVVSFTLNPALLAMRNMMRSEYARFFVLGIKRKESDLNPTQLIHALSQVLTVPVERRRDAAELILSFIQVRCQEYAEAEKSTNSSVLFEDAVAKLTNEIRQVIERSALLR